MKTGKLLFLIWVSLACLFAGCGKDEKAESDLELPTVDMKEVLKITPETASVEGEVYSDGGYTVEERGVCLSKTPAPTINDLKFSAGAGKGEFECRLTGLTPGTTYYVRAFAINKLGCAYSEEEVFATAEETTPQDIVTIREVKQTSYDYSSTGFLNNNTYYNYKYDWTIQISLSGYRQVEEFGFELNGFQKFYFSSIKDGIHSEDMVTYSDWSSTSITCKAYAMLLDGSYIYGEEETLYLTASSQKASYYYAPKSKEGEVSVSRIKAQPHGKQSSFPK